MKRYVYTYEQNTRWRDGFSRIYHTVRIYRIGRADVRLLVELVDTYVNEWQLVLMALETIKGADRPPKALFERSPMGGWAVPEEHAAKERGLADITRIV